MNPYYGMKKKQNCNNNFIGTQYEEFDAKNIDHIISVSYIKSLFSMKHPMEIEVHCAKRKFEEFKLPSIFKINDTQSDYTEHFLSLTSTFFSGLLFFFLGISSSLSEGIFI